MDIFQHVRSNAARPAADLRRHTANGQASAAVEDWDAGLVAATEAPDPELAFVVARREVDWERRSAEDHVRAAELALAAGAHLAARELSQQGHARFPEHEELARWAHVLAPARIVSTGGEPTPELGESAEWLDRHHEDYRGQWVALRGGELVMAASTLGEIYGELGSAEGLLVTQVL